MLADQITIPVDELNDGTTVNKAFTRFSEFQNRSTYVSGAHTTALKDELSFYRTFPKRNGNFNGVAKVALKFSEDKSVPGYDSATTINAPAIIEVSFSVPVGVSAADLLKQRQAVVALLDDDTIMDKLILQQMI